MFESYESFSPEEKKLLSEFVSHTESNVFVLKNLPEVIKGALFSRYSRSSLGLRSLLMKDFMQDKDSLFQNIVQTGTNEGENVQSEAIQKAQSFYDRILDGYGDDSIGELGGTHLALENISMLAAKIIQDGRIGGSPLEKSTRYIYFDKKINGKYPYRRSEVFKKAGYSELYEKTCDMLFDTYKALSEPLTEYMEKQFPQDENTPDGAYNAALRAKVLDCLRGILPASTLTNMGVYGNGRFFEKLVRLLHQSSLSEMRELGQKSQDELSKVVPSFIRRAHPEHPHYQKFKEYEDQVQSKLSMLCKKYCSDRMNQEVSVDLVDYDKDAPQKVARALLFGSSLSSMKEHEEVIDSLSEEELSSWFEELAEIRENRRHKSPRAAEHAFFTFEIVADFGVYRDLQRHRMLTQEKQRLTCDLGYTIPEEIIQSGLEKPYREALEKAKEAYTTLAKEYPDEAQYIVPMAYHIRWYFKANLRALQWLCELRAGAAGHAQYRFIAQEMARKVCEAYPCFDSFFKFVDYEGHPLGRLNQETRRVSKQESFT